MRGLPDPTLMIGQENDLSASRLTPHASHPAPQAARRKPQAARPEDFIWALKDINFEVKQGEVLGIIGKNGAGKSTLLKLLSRVTAPTTGSIKIRGRIASLLEVGTGFHPDLTGRENIFLNGAILGMTKSEIRSKLEEIVDFAGIAKYIDTPVKRYSSGMYVRLAFAVAAHLEPEILIVDEVLAVGDAEFQKKALGKMHDISTDQGRTVLFVSHNMVAIENLCDKGLFLTNGRVNSINDTKTVITNYLSLNSDYSQNNDISFIKERKGNGILRFSRIVLVDDKTSNEVTEIKCGSTIRIRLFLEMKESIVRDILFGIGINDQYERRISFISNQMLNQRIDLSIHGNNIIDVLINKFPFTPGKYNLTLFCSIKGEIADWIQNAFYFNVYAGDFYSTGREFPSEQGNFLIDYSFCFLSSKRTSTII